MLGRKFKWQYAVAALFVGGLVLFPFSGSIYYTSLMIVIAIYSMLTIGLCLLMGYTGQVSLGHAAFYGTGAFISAILTAKNDWSPWLAMPLAAISTGVIAYLVGLPIFRLRGNYLAMGTLGLGIIFYILFNELDQYTGGPSGLPGVPGLSIAGFAFDTDFRYYYLVWVVCAAMLIISHNIIRSRSGRALRAIHGSEAASESVGINVPQFKIQVFVLSAVFASIAGSLYVHYLAYVSPSPFDFIFSIKLVLMAVIGGLANIWGAVFGAAAVVMIDQHLGAFGELDTILFGLILMVVMIFMSRGLIPGIGNLYEKWQNWRAKVQDPSSAR
ncbi:MAG: branched-chain amino acid ABC transporter permease [Chloroflexi bacterium]|nr:branched-chain amino acid ABC transporter permease [Chloroflexota bacterium]